MPPTYAANPLYGSDPGPSSQLRFFPESAQPKTFAAGVGTIPIGAPVAFLADAEEWAVWNPLATQIDTITKGTATGGTFTYTVNGATTGTIAWNATAATIKTAIVAALIAAGRGNADDLDTAGTLATGNVVITWKGRYAGQTMTTSLNGASLTGGTAHTLVATQTGVTGQTKIRGFLHPDAITLDDTNSVLGVVMLSGRVHVDDIPLIGGATDELLAAALRDGVRELGFTIEGLTQFR